MLVRVLATLHLLHVTQCQLSCYHCPAEKNSWNFIVTADNVPETLVDCSFEDKQSQCSISITWLPGSNRTEIELLPGDERRDIAERDCLENTIILKNHNPDMRWIRSVVYTCSTDRCNSLSTIQRLLRALTLQDHLPDLDYLLQSNPTFNGSSCWFVANSSFPCDKDTDPTRCQQCTTAETIQPGTLDICGTCVDNDDVVENFITREVKFYMDNRQRDDFWIIECQVDGCNAINTSYLVQEKVKVQFDFDRFLNNGGDLRVRPSWIVMLLSIYALWKEIVTDG